MAGRPIKILGFFFFFFSLRFSALAVFTVQRERSARKGSQLSAFDPQSWPGVAAPHVTESDPVIVFAEPNVIALDFLPLHIRVD